MASPSELTLDYKPNTNTYPMIQRRFGDQHEDQTQKIEDFLARLEEERLKIEAFKRELPLCMQLLNNAVEIYRRQLETYQSCGQGAPRPPVLEEFITLSNMNINGATEETPPATSEKANWMVSAQLWSPAGDQAAKQQHPLDIVPAKQSVVAPTYDMSTKLARDSKQRNGGAFLPFSKEKITDKGPGLGSELALASAEKEVEEKRSSEMDNGEKRDSLSGMNGIGKSSEQGIKGGSNSGEGQAAAGAAGQSTHRKARRCWSPDLHRRFVNALQMLGGSQVATPKQIRELMKVDGLTNDEVKSHLQKYRLHTRRPIQPPQPPATAAPQLVVLGGIWVTPEYAATAAGGPTIYGAHPAATGAAAHCPIPHDFYASPQPPPHGHYHHHPLHRAAVPDKATMHSPDSELRSGRDRSESIEEGEERDVDDDEEQEEDQEEEMEEVKADDKALVPVDQSNGSGSDVALKF